VRNNEGLRAWLEVAYVIRTSFPPHLDVCVPRDAVPGPREAGLQRTLGLGRGKHYSLPLPDGGRLHVRVRGGDCYLAHWDVRDPHRDPIGHLILDSPDLTATLAGGLSAIAGFIREGITSLGGLGFLAVGGLIAGFILSNAALLLFTSLAGR